MEGIPRPRQALPPETAPYVTAVYGTPAKLRSARRNRSSKRPATPAMTIALAAPPFLGAGADALFGLGSGWGLAIGAVVGAVWSTVLASRRNVLSWVAPLPALVVASVAVAFGMLTNVGGTPLTRLVESAVTAFPAMAAAECAVLVVAVTRAIRSGRVDGSAHE
ncbi:DUF6542 domain-containing protein [Streptomyces sioyaensis]|uniref:DUF6542 domain-containing protein n=1 Tax=Streptomyces sioyaensis TaxID=67364 RepID=UPI0037CFA0B1